MLMFWAFWIIGYRFVLISQERQLLTRDFLNLEKGERIIPEKALKHYHEIDEQIKGMASTGEQLLPSVIKTALHHFHATHAIGEVSQAIKERVDSAAEQLDTELTLIRYIAWAIPSVGFIGTVRGIGEALGQAEQALQGRYQWRYRGAWAGV